MVRGKRKLIIGGAVAAVVAVALGAGALYHTLVPHNAPRQASLAGAVASLNAPRTTEQSAPSGEAAAPHGALTGTWTLATDGESFVGYRVREELAGFGAFTAVGRTKALKATLEFDGTAITNVQVTADLTALKSDSGMRDTALKTQALETGAYPTVTFDLTQPIALDGVPGEGETVSATAVGDLTLHGVTRSVSIPLQGQMTSGLIVVVGSLDIRFADFQIKRPRSPAVLGIEDHGLIELQIVFQQGSRG